MQHNKVVIPYTPRPLQREFHSKQKRFSVAVCHRRFGKTVMAINWLLREILVSGRKNAVGAYIAPTYSSAKRISWTMLREYAGNIPGVRFNEAELRCDLPDGKKIYLLGAESPDALRGLGLSAAVMDEYADMSARLYPEIIRPALSDFGDGKALWIGTPRGENQFKEIYDHAVQRMNEGDPEWFAMLFPASKTGVLSQKELDDARAIVQDESQYLQEYECSWSAALVGSFFAFQLDEIDSKDQIGNVPWEPNLEVITSWDLGMSDATAIWFAQQHPRSGEVRIIDYYEASGEGLHHYIRELKNKPYQYSKHFFPFDVMVRELGSGSSRYEMLQQLGIRPSIVARLPVQDGIEAVRSLIPRCWIDRSNCAAGLKALRHYHRTMNQRTGDWNSKPNHDWSSHACDSFRYLAVGLRDGDEDADLSYMARTGMTAGGQRVIDPGDGSFG